MTDKQKIFADEYLIDLNATRAYRVAYPNVKKDETAAAAAARMLRNVKVVSRLEELAKDAIRKQIISADKRAMYLSKIVEDNTMDPFARIRAIDILNKMDGLYVFKAEISLKSNAAKTLKVRKAVHL